MVMSPVHQVSPKPSCKAQWKGEEDEADRGRGGKTTSRNRQAWSSASPRGQWRTGKMEETGCEIICGAPMTLAVMMMISNWHPHPVVSLIITRPFTDNQPVIYLRVRFPRVHSQTYDVDQQPSLSPLSRQRRSESHICQTAIGRILDTIKKQGPWP